MVKGKKKGAKNPGFCVYHLSHGGVGKVVEFIKKDWRARQKELNNSGDTNDVSCGPDEKKVISRYWEKRNPNKKTQVKGGRRRRDNPKKRGNRSKKKRVQKVKHK